LRDYSPRPWILIRMSESLDVRGAIREANSVFCRFPFQICLPMVTLGIAYYAVRPPSQPGTHPHGIALLVIGITSFWLISFAEVVVAAMYLRAQEGAMPAASQFGDVLRYRGFASLVWRLFLRYLGWILLLFAILIVVILALVAVIAFVGALAHPGVGSAVASGAAAAGASGFLRWMSVRLGVIGGVAIAVAILCRYMFVLPMFAIAHASGPGFLADCVARTKHVWKTATLILLVGAVPGGALAWLKVLAWKHLSPPHGVRVAVELATIVLRYCYSAWFVLLKTGLAQQLMCASIPVPPPSPLAEPGDFVNRVGPPPL
jgi:hypothetical protein